VGKHEVGFARVEKDLYRTPAWVIEALLEHIDIAGLRIWECAAGDGRMAEALKTAGASVYTSDIETRGYKLDAVFDFVAGQTPAPAHFDGIITNPPFGPRGTLARQFVEAGLRLMPTCPFLALLLAVDYDSGKTRKHLFRDCRHFAGKIVLTDRIVWFENPDPDKEAPKENHAWYLWSWNAIRARPPITLYAGKSDGR
jgi:hypothetical protein